MKKKNIIESSSPSMANNIQEKCEEKKMISLAFSLREIIFSFVFIKFLTFYLDYNLIYTD